MTQNQNNIKQYNTTFEVKMEEIGLMPLIKNYESIKQSEIRNNKKFEKFSTLFKNKKDEKIKILYEEVCSELEKIKMLSLKLDGIIGSLKVVVNEKRPSQEIISKLSKMFKDKLREYEKSFYRFKDIFNILKKITENKYFDDQKTR